MLQDKNLGVAFLAAARQTPDAEAIVSEGVRLTYGQMHPLIVNFTLNMQRHGIDRSATVAVFSDDLLVVLATLFGTALLGCRWVRASPYLFERGNIAVSHVLASPDMPAMNRPHITVDESWALRPAGTAAERPAFPGYASPDSPWLVAQTSGTTGAPKFLELSQAMMFDRARAAADDFVPLSTRSVCLFPITAFPYVTRALTTLLNGATIVQSANPGFWVKQGTTLVTGSGSQLRTLFADVSLKTKLPTLHVGGSPLSDRQAAEYLENFEQVVDLYGSTESNRAFKNIKTRAPDGKIKNTPQKLDSEVEIVDASGQPVAPGQRGEVRVRNAYLVHDYLDSPEAAELAFRGGWFYPGDLGYWDSSGALIIVGRSNDQFNVGGVKISAAAVDVALLSVEGVRDAMSFMMQRDGESEDLLAFLTLEPDAQQEDVIKRATEECLKSIGSDGVPARFLFAPKLPRNANGKPDRTACALMAMQRRVGALAQR